MPRWKFLFLNFLLISLEMHDLFNLPTVCLSIAEHEAKALEEVMRTTEKR